MYWANHLRILLLTAMAVCLAVIGLPGHAVNAQELISSSPQEQFTEGRVRWGARPGVSRYRLQLARNQDFTDIVFDRVIDGNQYQINDLAPGRYFWRVAALTAAKLEFSSASAIEIGSESRPEATALVQTGAGTRTTKTPSSNAIAVGDGWHALIGNVSTPVLAHLRSPSVEDLVAANSEGIVYALGADNGILLWTGRANIRRTSSMRPTTLLIARSANGLDNVIVLASNVAIALDGRNGRELWRTVLPAVASEGAAFNDVRGPQLFIVDSSRQRMLLIDGNTGTLTSQTDLSGRVFGRPVPYNHEGVLIAFENGRIETRDRAGRIIKSGDVSSAVSTPPLFVKGPRGGLVLVGTRSGLTALDGGDLHALGRVALKDDAPRGALVAADLDGNGATEVIMLTNRGHVVAVNASDGKILWDAPGATDAASIALADVNGDRVLDVLIAGGQDFAMALSGRDGSLLWKEESAPLFVANHTGASLMPRSLVAVAHGSGALLIGVDPSRVGLRAVEFSKGRVAAVSH